MMALPPPHNVGKVRVMYEVGAVWVGRDCVICRHSLDEHGLKIASTRLGEVCDISCKICLTGMCEAR